MKQDKKVVVTHGNGPFENAKNALLGLDLSRLKGKSVLIKPNLGRFTDATTGINTHPQAIAGVIEALQQAGSTKIAIGESPILGVKVTEVYQRMGVDKVAEKYGCELIDFDAIKPVKKEVPQGRVLESTLICAPIYEYDFLLSLPVTKMHMHTVVTLGIKNMKGCLFHREKVRYHQLEYKEGQVFPDKTLDTAISDLGTILLPDITVVDGFVGMEGIGPSGGESIESNFALASFNAVAADMIACQLMGVEPEEVPHLRLISERVGFSMESNDYNMEPDNYLDYKVQYKLPPKEISLEYKDVVLYDKESCSACLSTVMFFLKRFKTDMSQYTCDDGCLHLAIGKGIDGDEVKNGTIFVGNCARNTKGKGPFVPGCPPVPTRIYKDVTSEEPDKNE